MNGRINDRFVLDSCTCMNFLNKKIRSLPLGILSVSVITRMEVLAKPDHTAESEKEARDFLGKLMVIPLHGSIERTATFIRREGSPRLKLPDAGQFGCAELSRSFGKAKTPQLFLHGVSS
ncbi:MAG: hypothetical protein LBL31_05265 [Spirochaetaceae bacterium]|jgi:hypothetical protein|nr:hypothetical protein [Spirochaetaceae bacterium]